MHPYILSVLKNSKISLPDGSKKPLTSNIDLDEAEFLSLIVSQLETVSLGVEVGLAYGVSAGVICSTASQKNHNYYHIAVDPYQGRDYGFAGVHTVKAVGQDKFRLFEERSDIEIY